MKIVVDTCAYCQCDVGNVAALTALESASQIFLPVIAYGELHYGFSHGTRLQANLTRLEQFIDQFQVDVIPIDIAVARKFGTIFASLRKKGTPIPTNDIWIAACCMEVGGTLLTCDGHFVHIAQIATELIPQK